MKNMQLPSAGDVIREETDSKEHARTDRRSTVFTRG